MVLIVPQPAHFAWPAVISSAKISLSIPAAALPSTRSESSDNPEVTACSNDCSVFPMLNSSRIYAAILGLPAASWSEAFCLDQGRVVPEFDERAGNRLNQRRRTAHKNARHLARCPARFGEHLPIDTPAKAGPAVGSYTREGMSHLKRRILFSKSGELTAVDHFLPVARREEESRREFLSNIGILARKLGIPVT